MCPYSLGLTFIFYAAYALCVQVGLLGGRSIWLFLRCWKAGGGLIPIAEAGLPEHAYKFQWWQYQHAPKAFVSPANPPHSPINDWQMHAGWYVA